MGIRDREEAERPVAQVALAKDLLILGAADRGAGDIPNNGEGWVRLNLVNTLVPDNDVGIFVEHWWKEVSSRRLSPHQYFCFVGAGYVPSSGLDSTD